MTSKNTQLETSTQRIKSVMEHVLQLAKNQGASDAFVAIGHDTGFSVDVRMGQVENVAFGEDQEVGVTVYFGQRKGHASSTDTSEKALEAMVKAACEIAKVSAADPCFGLADKELMTKQFPDLNLYHEWKIDPAEAIKRALSCESQALSLDKRIVNSDGVTVSTGSSHHGFATTHGGEGVIHTTRHSMSCSLIAKSGEDMQRDYDYTTVRDPKHLVSVELLAENAVTRTVQRLNARQIKTQKAPVVFSNRVASGLFSSFTNAISGSNLYKKNSFLLDSLGKSAFPEFINIYEQPYLPGALGSSPFDGEGVPTRENRFVEQGKVCQYVLGSYSARRMGLKTTANSSGVHNLTIDPNALGLVEILKHMGTGLLVTELMGQGVNVLTGDYSRGARGFWVEEGEIQYPVSEITIASNLREVFKGITLVGADINPNVSTRCGAVLVNEMMIGGS